MPSHLGFFVLSHSKRNMNKFVNEIDGLYSKKIYYQDADSIMSYGSLWKIKEAGYVGNNLGQRKNEYCDSGNFFSPF